MKVYVVIELDKNKQVPSIIGTYKDKKKAEDISNQGTAWRNVVTQEVQ